MFCTTVMICSSTRVLNKKCQASSHEKPINCFPPKHSSNPAACETGSHSCCTSTQVRLNSSGQRAEKGKCQSDWKENIPVTFSHPFQSEPQHYCKIVNCTIVKESHNNGGKKPCGDLRQSADLMLSSANAEECDRQHSHYGRRAQNQTRSEDGV